jgi:hypothetical protein
MLRAPGALVAGRAGPSIVVQPFPRIQIVLMMATAITQVYELIEKSSA